MKPILNLDEVTLEHLTHGDRFEVRDGAIAAQIGARLLGYSVCVVPPGKRAYPLHCHHINEEMFLVLEGSGMVRFGEHEYPIRKGDLIAAPPGGRDTAHQIVNTSQEELRYLCVSTMIPQDVIEYPDSDKVLVAVGSPPGGDPAQRSFHFRGRLGARTEYWDGE